MKQDTQLLFAARLTSAALKLLMEIRGASHAAKRSACGRVQAITAAPLRPGCTASAQGQALPLSFFPSFHLTGTINNRGSGCSQLRTKLKVCLELPATPRPGHFFVFFSSFFPPPGLAVSSFIFEKSGLLIKCSTSLALPARGCLGYPVRHRALVSNYRKSTPEQSSYLHANNSGACIPVTTRSCWRLAPGVFNPIRRSFKRMSAERSKGS